MLQKLRRRQRGFTLIELLIVVAIIGIIAAMLVPNFLDALQKAKQKRSQADVRNWGTAAMTLTTDLASGGAAGQQWAVAPYSPATLAYLQSILTTRYIQTIVERDGWKNFYSYYYPNPLSVVNSRDAVAAAISLGRDGDTVTAVQATYTSGPFDPTDYNQDIVWADGFFVRWPQKVTS
jgi:prepilin-type N-terminal cleavage/methylation domain-containing protein